MVNTIGEARDVLNALVADTWQTNSFNPPILYDNIKGARPEGRDMFARVVVRHYEGDIAALGTTMTRSWGYLYVQLFAPEGTGTADLDEISDALIKAFVAASPADLQGIRLMKPVAIELGVDPSDRQYHQVNVQVMFSYDTRS